MEGLALTGASIDRDRGLLSTIVLEMGGSSRLCAMLKPGEPLVLITKLMLTKPLQFLATLPE